MDSSPPGSYVHGILQARTLEWVAIPFSRDFPDPGIESVSLISPSLAGGFFTISATSKPIKLTYDPTNPLLGIYLEETTIEKDT